MLERLLAMLRPRKLEDKSSREVQVIKALPGEHPARLFDQRLAELAADEGILAGSLQLIGLDDIKAALGILWENISSQINRISEEEIGARLTDRDIFRMCNDHTFLICFRGTDQDRAAKVAADISAAIRNRIKAEIPVLGGRITISATTAIVMSADLQEAADLSGRMITLLQRVREDRQKTALKHQSYILQNVSLQFSPAISLIKNRVVFNTCSQNSALGFSSLATFRAMTDPERYQDTVSQLDLTLLASAVEALHLSIKQRGCCPILVPVHLSSLCEQSFRREYVKVLDIIPEAYSRLILIELTGYATDAERLDLLFVAAELKKRVKRLVLEVPLESQEMFTLEELPVWGVSTSLSGRTSFERELPILLRRYVQRAAGAGLSTIGHGANSLGLAILAQKAGFSAIDGPAVCPAASHPKPSFAVAPLDRGSSTATAVYRKE